MSLKEELTVLSSIAEIGAFLLALYVIYRAQLQPFNTSELHPDTLKWLERQQR